MLAQLYQANLIVSDVAPDTARLFERHQKRQRQEIKSQIFGIFFLRIRGCFDPDNLPQPGVAGPPAPLHPRHGDRVASSWWPSGLAAVFSHWDRAATRASRCSSPGICCSSTPDLRWPSWCTNSATPRR